MKLLIAYALLVPPIIQGWNIILFANKSSSLLIRMRVYPSSPFAEQHPAHF